MNIKIILKDQNILVVEKPSGLVVHPFDNSIEYTLVDFLYENYPEMFSINNNVTLQDGRTVALGGIVHKLDRDTSGILIIAKTQNIFDELKTQFRNHTIKKIYIAIVEGIIDKNKFTIDSPLGRNKKDYRQSVNPKNLRGQLREAITEVEVIERRGYTTLVKLYPKTGRTHQLRAHMSSINHSIVGDKTYGSKIDSPRIMLHSESLIIKIEGEEKIFSSERPKEFSC